MIAPCENYALIERIIKHPKVWPWVADDFTFEFEPNGNHLYLSIEDKGIVVLKQLNHICYQLHIALLPELWGRGKGIGAMAQEWIFEKTPCRKLVAFVPEDNKPVKRLAERCGMKEEGRITKSFCRGLVLRDQIIYGFERGR
jgi:RimJ/RimL family protein N-acetyltransferase